MFSDLGVEVIIPIKSRNDLIGMLMLTRTGRDGRVTNYRGDYESYLYAVNREIEEGEREVVARSAKRPEATGKSAVASSKPARRAERHAARATPRRTICPASSPRRECDRRRARTPRRSAGARA